MTFEEYKAKLDTLIKDSQFCSIGRMWMNHPQFNELVADPEAKKYLHELLTDHPSWQLYSVVTRVYPELKVQEKNYGRFKEIGIDMLNWLEENC